MLKLVLFYLSQFPLALLSQIFYKDPVKYQSINPVFRLHFSDLQGVELRQPGEGVVLQHSNLVVTQVPEIDN